MRLGTLGQNDKDIHDYKHQYVAAVIFHTILWQYCNNVHHISVFDAVLFFTSLQWNSYRLHYCGMPEDCTMMPWLSQTVLVCEMNHSLAYTCTFCLGFFAHRL